MAKRNFTTQERYAVWTSHGEKCWICQTPLAYREMHVDHIIPETLEGKPELAKVIREFALPKTFDLNSWANWMPAHGPCNVQKRAHVFNPSPLIQSVLERSIKKAPEVKALYDKRMRERSLDLAFDEILEAVERGEIGPDRVSQISELVRLKHEPNREPEMAGKPIMLGPGLTVLQEDERHYLLQGPGGMVGVRPKGDRLDSSWDCPYCGFTGWNGTRCIRCGQFIDPE